MVGYYSEFAKYYSCFIFVLVSFSLFTSPKKIYLIKYTSSKSNGVIDFFK